MSKTSEALPLPPLYYQSCNKGYWREDSNGRWIELNQESALGFIISQGFSKEGGNGVSEASQCLLRIQTEQNVDYAGRLAGYDAGVYQISGRNILVTESPKKNQPRKGEWPLLKEILAGMFGEEQLPYFYGWMKKSVECYSARRWTPGQVMVLAGPVNSAKSLLQGIITEIFGGRSAKPYLYMTGKTTFNADLFGSEHLMVEDDAESTDYKARRHFGANVKGIAVNKNQHCHGKHKEALTLTPVWRLTMSLNDEPGRLQVLPPLEDDVGDKMILLKVTKREMPMPTETPEEQDRFWKALVAEIPAFLDFLQTWTIPEDKRHPRFGIKEFHHPDLVSALWELSPEQKLLALIDIECFRVGDDVWNGTAAELEGHLVRQESHVAREAQKLLGFNTACGSFLGNLAKSGLGRDRVSKRIVHGTTVWTIQPPPPELRNRTPGGMGSPFSQQPGPPTLDKAA